MSVMVLLLERSQRFRCRSLGQTARRIHHRVQSFNDSSEPDRG